MYLKTFAVLLFVAVCAALPVDDGKAGDVHPPPQDPSQTAEVKEDGSDLKTDATFWGGYGGYYRYPSYHRRSFNYYPSYRPRYYHYTYPAYQTYWNSYW